MKPFQVAAVQMVAGPSVEENLAAAPRLVHRSAGRGPQIDVLT